MEQDKNKIRSMLQSKVSVITTLLVATYISLQAHYRYKYMDYQPAQEQPLSTGKTSNELVRDTPVVSTHLDSFLQPIEFGDLSASDASYAPKIRKQNNVETQSHNPRTELDGFPIQGPLGLLLD